MTDRSQTNSPCQICGVGALEHTTREVAGTIRHLHSTDGQLTPLDPSTMETRPQRLRARSDDQVPTVIVAPAPDLELRQLLLELGVISAEQMARIRPSLPTTRYAVADPSSQPLSERAPADPVLRHDPSWGKEY